MGQRSQIYIRYQNKTGTHLLARYYQWNHGEYMVSRARSITDWLHDHLSVDPNFLDFPLYREKLARICDVDFDFRDVAMGIDMMEAARGGEDGLSWSGPELSSYLFGWDNDSGHLFLDVGRDGTIRYAFADPSFQLMMDGNAYMIWARDRGWEDEPRYGRCTAENAAHLDAIARFMTVKEFSAFRSADYTSDLYGIPF